MHLIDTTSNAVTDVPIGPGSADVAITPNGAFAYVSAVDNTVRVIDTGTNLLVATVPVGQTPSGIAVDPNGTFAYVANINANSVSKISTATNAVVATIPVGSRPVGIAFRLATHGPTDKDQCKDGGWATFTSPTFSNQGQCVSFVNHMNHSQ
jgi:YVTN family beta-propeller protein